jgi:molecular chaperone DnaK
MHHQAIGIDLGTTYSAVAHLDSTGRPVTLVNAEGDLVTPSVVLFEPGNIVVGKEALKAVATDANLVALLAKRELGDRTFDKDLGGRKYPPEAIEAFILNKLKNDVSRQIGGFNRCVITVPAYFDEVRRKATQDAGYMAGLDVMDIINEPTAAAIAHGYLKGFLNEKGESTAPRKLLVYDLGGGTFDVTVMEIRGNQFLALATDGDVQLGGYDWDTRMVNHVAEAFKRQHGLDPRDDPNTAGRLWRECEDAKRTLSARTKANITCDYKGHAIRVELTREQFEELTHDLLDRTLFTTRQTLQAAGLTWNDIDYVLLVGGSTRMPMIGRALRNASGKEPDGSVAVDEAVAHGAALHAGVLLARHSGQAPKIKIKNVNSHSLGIVATDNLTGRKRNAVLIPRNTKLPVNAKRTFRTQKPGQKSILVRIVEGESANPDDCTQIGQCAARDLPANLPAQTPIDVKFHYAENGRLTVAVSVEGTAKELKHTITRDNSLTQEQLDAWRGFVCGTQ